MKKYKYYLKIIYLFLVHLNIIKSRPRLVVFKDNSAFKVRNIMDIWTLTETYLNHDYEKHFQIKSDWNIIDIGAAIGDFTLLAAKKSPNGKVFAVEPYFPSFEILKNNLTLNNIKNVISSNFAIGSKNGQLSIDINQKNLANNTTSTTMSKSMVKAVTLENYFAINQISHCHLLKCDCEGAEFDIFEKLSPSLSHKIDRIIMEYHLFNPKDSLDSLAQKLEKLGYCLKISPNPAHQNIGFLYAYKN